MKTINQLSKLTGKSQALLRYHCRVGNIKATKFGRDWLIDEKEVKRLLNHK